MEDFIGKETFEQRPVRDTPCAYPGENSSRQLTESTGTIRENEVKTINGADENYIVYIWIP